MKKVFLALILLASAVFLLGLNGRAAGTGNLVVHFQAWDGEYDTLGSWAWGDTAAGRLKDGVDDFGAYFNFDNVAVGTAVGFIAVEWPSGTGPDWGMKLTGDVNLGADVIEEGKTVHVYVWEGANGAQYLKADPERYNVIAVYYDPAGAYEETLGLHHWGWTLPGPAWATPDQILVNVGVAESGYPIKATILSAVETWAGFLIYAGDDATKKTGDLKPDTGFFTNQVVGTTEVVYVVNAGDAVTDNSNVFLTPAEFAEEAFSFKLMPYVPEEKDGTYAVDPNTIILKTSASVASPYPAATDKEEAQAMVESWFMVKEVISEGVYGEPLAIERVDFAKSNTTLNAFVIILEDALDNTKDYEVFFDLGYPSETLTEAREVTVTINLTVPANTPVDAVLSAAGGFNGWAPGTAEYVATKVDATHYTLTFTVDVTNPYTTFEYKWTRGAWGTEEFVEGNRPLVVPNNVDSITFDDVVEAWADVEAPANKYAAPVRETKLNFAASIEVAMDTMAPELTFISPAGIVGVDAAQRIIDVPWGQPFNQNLFPRFRANDDRDGDITAFVYVPKGANSVLDTRTEGNYTIMLRVVDRWGNVTEETFIFRVVKPAA